MAQKPGRFVKSGQAYLGRFPSRVAGSLLVKPKRIPPFQLLEISANLTQMRSLILTGRAEKVIARQKLSKRLAKVPSREMRILSP